MEYGLIQINNTQWKIFLHPKKIKDIQSFLGLAGYYRKFIENFSKISKPLTKKKGEKFNCVTMHLVGQRSLPRAAPHAEFEPRQRLSLARTSPSVGHPIIADHGPFSAPFSKRGEPVNTFHYLPIFGSKRPAGYINRSDCTKSTPVLEITA